MTPPIENQSLSPPRAREMVRERDRQLCDGVVCYAGVDWWYHNRGHSECQIMTRLARRTTVLWINSIGMRMPAPGKSELSLTRYLRKIRSTLKGLRRDASGMWIYSPIFLPRYDARSLALNGVLLSLQAKMLCRLLKIRRPALWITLPTAAPAAERGSWGSIVFNRCDDFAAFPEADGDSIAGLERRLLAIADEVAYVSPTLLERERPRVRRATFLGHGVDFAHFARSRSRSADSAPEVLRSLPRPIVGFYGALDDYTIDLELLVKTARHIGKGTLVVIGPQAMELSPLLREPNVRYLGPVPYQQLPDYAAQFDVALMPWLQNDWIEACNPIKLKEYLALGFPIASIRFRTMEPYAHLIHGASSHEEFLDAVDRALAENDPSLVEQRRQAVADDGWDQLTERVGTMLRLPAAGSTS